VTTLYRYSSEFYYSKEQHFCLRIFKKTIMNNNLKTSGMKKKRMERVWYLLAVMMCISLGVQAQAPKDSVKGVHFEQKGDSREQVHFCRCICHLVRAL
jgi:hypothetical protein